MSKVIVAETSPIAETFTLRKENGGWLAQIVITSDGMFSAVSDYGNFSFSWRSIGSCTFKEFLISLNIGYFGGKMNGSYAYVVYNKKVEKAAYVFAEHILPPLQAYLKATPMFFECKHTAKVQTTGGDPLKLFQVECHDCGAVLERYPDGLAI